MREYTRRKRARERRRERKSERDIDRDRQRKKESEHIFKLETFPFVYNRKENPNIFNLD